MSLDAPMRAVAGGLGCLLTIGCARHTQAIWPASTTARAAPDTLAALAARPWTDSSAQTPQRQIYRTWMRYLDSSGRRYYGAAFRPSPYWVESEQHQWRVYAFALAYLPDSAVPEVLTIEPVPDGSGEYRLVTRFTSTNENNAMRSRTATLTVFAVPSTDGWRIANALPRLTRSWRRDTIGAITYVMAPSYSFDRARGDQAAAFIDSLAAALRVPRVDHLTYYLASSVDEVSRIMGLETPNKWGPVGGLAQPTNYQLFSGIPSLGEYYRHELTHVVILPLMGTTTYFVSEGVPTWLGGTTGMDFRAAARGLAVYLQEHPAVDLDSILTGRYPVQQFYPAGAVFVKLVYDHGGTEALKALFDCGPTVQDLRMGVERLLDRPWPSIAAEWRQLVLSFASAPS